MFTRHYLACSLAALGCAITSLQAETLGWNFGDADGVVDTGTPLSNFTASAFTIGNSNGVPAAGPFTTTSASSGYAGSSGTGNMGTPAKIGAFDAGTSSYFEITFTPATGFAIEISDCDFGVRSTGTGAQTFALATSIDNYATNVVSGTIANSGSWAFKANTGAVIRGAVDQVVTARLYVYGGAGTPTSGTVNTRVDDLTMVVQATTSGPVPQLTASLAPNSVSENAGTSASVLTVTRPAPLTGDLTVSVFSSDSSEAVPAAATVVIPDGQASAQMDLTAVNDTLVDGPQSVTITATAAGFSNATATLTVTDDEVAPPAVTSIFINEVDIDQPGTDAGDFIELYTPEGHRSLNGLVVVLFNGNGAVSYLTIDLNTYTTDANGLFLIGPPAMTPTPDFVIPTGASGWVQNGPDAIALYRATAATFPGGTAPTATNLLDSVIYNGSTGGTLAGLTSGLASSDVLEELTVTGVNFSLSRRGDGKCAWISAPPTPKALNGGDLTYADFLAVFPGIGTPTDDPDGDGLTNAQEFLFGGNPNNPGLQFPQAAAAAAPSTARGFTFKKRACPPAGLSYVMETSDDMSMWTVVSHLQTARSTNSDGTETVTWMEPADPTGARRYLRIKPVVQP